MYVDYTEVHEPSGQLAGEIREMPNYLHSVLLWFVCGLIRMVNYECMCLLQSHCIPISGGSQRETAVECSGTLLHRTPPSE